MCLVAAHPHDLAVLDPHLYTAIALAQDADSLLPLLVCHAVPCSTSALTLLNPERRPVCSHGGVEPSDLAETLDDPVLAQDHVVLRKLVGHGVPILGTVTEHHIFGGRDRASLDS